MKTIYIKDSCCGIKIYCPDEYNCILINDRKNKESILRLTKLIPSIANTVFIDICFDSLGTFTDSRNCRINSSEYSYIMKNHKTNIKSYHYYSTNNPGINVKYNYQDNEYLTEQLEPINAVLNDHGVKIGCWFIKSDIVYSKMVGPIVGERLTYYNEPKNMFALTDSDSISKMNKYVNGSTTYNKRIFLEIKDIIINDPATIILWKDGTKTVVKCQNEDTFDPGTGIAMAILKKLYGNSGFYKDIFEPAIMKYELKKSLEKSKNNVAKKKEKKPPIK
mgnify:CR=1 FL=1|nr:MAG TPA: hypothetical protein [Caudoviricetes sp.]